MGGWMIAWLLAGCAPATTSIATDPCVVARLPAGGPLEGSVDPDDLMGVAQTRLREHHLTGDAGFAVLAEQALRCHLDAHRADPEATRLLARTWMQLHHFRRAEALLRKRVAAAPDDGQAWLLLADSLLEQGRPDEAEAALQRTVGVAPSLVADRQAWLSAQRGQGAEALAHAQRAVRLAPDDDTRAWALTQVGRYRMLQGEVPKELGHALLLDPDLREAHYWLGRHLLSEGHPAAEEHLRADGDTLRATIGLHELGLATTADIEAKASYDPRGYQIWRLMQGLPADVGVLQAEHASRADPLTATALALARGEAPPALPYLPVDPDLRALRSLGPRPKNIDSL